MDYAYDVLDRLIVAVAPSGEAAVWSYDAAGNVLAIRRVPAGTVEVLDVRPRSAPVGARVTVVGLGFSAAAAENRVEIGGVLARTVSASPMELTVEVPAGAASGAVTVTTPSSIGSAPAAFVLSPAAPVILSVTPTVATPGDTIEIRGADFPSADELTVRIGGVDTVPDGVSASAITVTLRTVGSGRVTVSGPSGTATTVNDLFVAPEPFGAAGVGLGARVTLGSTTPVTLGAGRIALLVFDGVRDQRVGVLVVSGSGVAQVSVLDRALAVLASAFVGAEVFGPVTLPEPATYAIVIDPFDEQPQTLTVETFDVPPDVAAPIAVNGDGVPVAIAAPGHRAHLSFEATAGLHVYVAMTEASPDMAAGLFEIELLRPAGSTLRRELTGSEAASFASGPLPDTGTYEIRMALLRARTGRLTVTVSQAVTAHLVVDGPVTVLTLVRPGQGAVVTFAGEAGRRAAVSFRDVLFGPGTPLLEATVLGPGGATLRQALARDGDDVIVDELPATDVYTVLIRPLDANMATFSVAVTA